jgi:hypothetical protein
MNAPRKIRVVARYGRESAVVRTFAAEHKARMLLDELRREYRAPGVSFWLTTRARRHDARWADLQGGMLRGELPVLPAVPATSAEEDAILKRGGTVRRLVWRPI